MKVCLSLYELCVHTSIMHFIEQVNTAGCNGHCFTSQANSFYTFNITDATHHRHFALYWIISNNKATTLFWYN